MGLFTAEFLAACEGNGIDWFKTTDLFAGTSVGSIIALGLAAEIRAETIREMMVEHAAHVFPQSVFPLLDTVGQATGASYIADRLGEVNGVQWSEKCAVRWLLDTPLKESEK